MRVYYLRVSVTFETQTCLLFVDMPEERHYGHRGRKYVCNKNTMLQLLLFVRRKQRLLWKRNAASSLISC